MLPAVFLKNAENAAKEIPDNIPAFRFNFGITSNFPLSIHIFHKFQNCLLAFMLILAKCSVFFVFWIDFMEVLTYNNPKRNCESLPPCISVLR